VEQTTHPESSEPGRREPWWKGTRGEWYLVVQGVIFLTILFGPRSLPGQSPWPEPWGLAAAAAGALLVVTGGALAVVGTLRLGRNLSALPYPVDGAPLVETGPYAIVRNPIYSGLILASFGWGLFVNGWLTLLYAAALFVFFDIKARREERWLCERHPEYGDYQKRVKKLVPWLY
jgi:protein-S-isoprenylcysteine O-methyltransferase Ste14